MRPKASYDPAVEPVEELADVGSLVVMSPPAQHRIEFLNQLLGLERHASPGKRAYLIHETADRFLPRDSVQFPRLSTTANLARRQPELLAALDLVPKKLESLPDMHDPCFLRMQLLAQFVQYPKRSRHCRPRLCCRFAGRYPVIGVPRKLISLAPHLLIERCQKYVTEQGRNHPALRSPALRWKQPPFAIAAGLEHRLNQAQHPAVGYSLGHQCEQFRMIHRPEKVLQIRVHDPLSSTLDLFPHFAHGILRRSPSQISEVGFIEYRLKDRLQPIEQRLLPHPVINRRDSQRAKLARLSRLRDLHLPHRLRPVDILFRFALQPIQPLAQLRGESFQTLPIHTSAAPVGFYHLPGHLQVLPLLYLVN